jgi:hypothetical protein
VSPRGALRRSLIVWGWGQIAAGDGRGWLGPPLQLGIVATLVALAPSAAQGTNAGLVFLGGAIALALWLAIPIHAYRVAARRRSAFDVSIGPASGLDLLWLTPFAVAFPTFFWTAAGRAGDPGLVLSDYVADWRAGRVHAAIGYFDTPPGGGVVADRWEAQLARVRNELVRLAAISRPNSGIDPERPLDSVVWSAKPSDEADTFVVALEVVRRETVRGQLLGFVPSTSQRIVTLERLGTAELRLVELPGQFAGQGWRIGRVEVGGIGLGS